MGKTKDTLYLKVSQYSGLDLGTKRRMLVEKLEQTEYFYGLVQQFQYLTSALQEFLNF